VIIYNLLMSTFYKGSQETGLYDNSKAEFSTAEKYYDIEESQRRYQELVDENIWLKTQI